MSCYTPRNVRQGGHLRLQQGGIHPLAEAMFLTVEERRHDASEGVEASAKVRDGHAWLRPDQHLLRDTGAG